jgi:glutamyl-tRNA synthetase
MLDRRPDLLHRTLRLLNPGRRRLLLACRPLALAGASTERKHRTVAEPPFAPQTRNGWRALGRLNGGCNVRGMVRVRFAPSPTGSLHVGNALTAVVNRSFVDERGGTFLLRIDDTDPTRNVPGGEEEIVRELEWLGIGWDDGPVRQSERQARYREAAAPLGDRFKGLTLLREDGTATYHLASVVDDVDFAITHVIRGNDHRSNEALHRRLHEALGTAPPEYVHHGLILGEDGKKLSKRSFGGTVASLREAGIPAEAVRAYLEELGLPKHDVRLDPARIRRLAVEAIAALPDAELAERAGAPVELVPALRGARDLNEAREYAQAILTPPKPVKGDAPETLERFRELVERANGTLDARALVRELKAVGGNLKALRIALTGKERGPELWAVIAALPRDEALRRIDAAL